MNAEATINVEHAAKQARLALTPGEKALLDDELPRMMAGFRRVLRAVETENVAPMIHGGNAAGGWRPDTPGPMLDRGEVLQQAPEHLGGEFKVPRIVE